MKYMIINIPTTEDTKIGTLDSILNLILTSSPDIYAIYMIIAI